MRQIIVIAHDIRSCHNVGSLLRTCECLGVQMIYLTGFTPYPHSEDDARLPHIAKKIDNAINKTALGAEKLVHWRHVASVEELLHDYRERGYQLVALEQTTTSQTLPTFVPAEKLVLLLGREVEGIDPALLQLCDSSVEIPMYGKKESFNVVQAAAIALYHLRTTA